MGRWLTPDEPPANKFFQRRVTIPATLGFLGPIDGALLELTYPDRWEQFGTLTPDQTAAFFQTIYNEFVQNLDEPPDWTNAEDVDGQPGQPWYDDLADFVIAGFLAITFAPGAAVVYQATIPKARIALRTGNLGALFKIFLNGLEMATGDSYSPITDILSQEYDLAGFAAAHDLGEPPWTLRIEHNGQNESVVGQAKLEFVRGEQVAAMVQTILRADPTGCGIQWSLDNGDTWETIDLATCITGLANDAIDQAIADGKISKPGQQPSPTSAPAVGECVTYHVVLDSRNRWHCPSPVSRGDSIRILNARGGWSDHTLEWFCPDGKAFVLGACAPGQRHETGDPSAGAYHMMPVANIGSSFYNCLEAAYTLASTDEQGDLFVQANDSTITDNQGQIEFDFQVCSGDYIWCAHFDFASSDGGFIAVPEIGAGIHVPGTGWYGTVISPDSRQVVIELPDHPGFIHLHTKIETYCPSGDVYQTYVQTSDGVYPILQRPAESGTHQYESTNANPETNASKYQVAVTNAGFATLDCYITQLWVTGKGPNPFNRDNC